MCILLLLLFVTFLRASGLQGLKGPFAIYMYTSESFKSFCMHCGTKINTIVQLIESK